MAGDSSSAEAAKERSPTTSHSDLATNLPRTFKYLLGSLFFDCLNFLSAKRLFTFYTIVSYCSYAVLFKGNSVYTQFMDRATTYRWRMCCKILIRWLFLLVFLFKLVYLVLLYPLTLSSYDINYSLNSRSFFGFGLNAVHLPLK